MGGLGALIVLTFVFGPTLAVVPLLMAIPAILTGFLLVGGVQQLANVSFLVEYLIALIRLGVAIDYSLLVVTAGARSERGTGNESAIMAAGATAGHAVVLSGLTVAARLLSLFVLPVSFLRSIGSGGMLIPLVALTAAIKTHSRGF
jgi:putative drug exporter of the RND superfamily